MRSHAGAWEREKKRILMRCLMQESDISAKVRQSCFSDPFSLQSKQLQPNYVSSYYQSSEGTKIVRANAYKLITL